MNTIEYAKRVFSPPVAARFLANQTKSTWGHKQPYACSCETDMLWFAFLWALAPEGYDYWQKIYNQIYEQEYPEVHFHE